MSAVQEQTRANVRLADSTEQLFAERLRTVRQARGLSAKELGQLVGLGGRVVLACEVGTTRGMRRVSVGESAAFCRALGVDLPAMLDPGADLETLMGASR